jgi:hypothetical protein
MNQRRRQSDDGLKVWEQFSLRHRKNPHPNLNPLYALPEKLINIIKEGLPRFLTAKEELFERDLARATAAGGFFHRRLFACPLSPPPPTPEQERQRQKIEALLTEAMREDGRNELQVQNYFQDKKQLEDDLHLRAVAYTSWLVTNPRFRLERDAVRTKWDERVAELGHFPIHRRSFLGEPPDPVGPEEARMLHFYRRWGLDTFATWELPVPMSPQLFHTFYADHVTLPQAGLLAFLPWYALRDERLTLKDLTKQLAAATRPEHLAGWMARGTEAKKKLGYQRLRHTLVVYRYWVLGLASRYPERLENHTERLDQAFATFMGLSTDSVKKVRLALLQTPSYPGENDPADGAGQGET